MWCTPVTTSGRREVSLQIGQLLRYVGQTDVLEALLRGPSLIVPLPQGVVLGEHLFEVSPRDRFAFGLP